MASVLEFVLKLKDGASKELQEVGEAAGKASKETDGAKKATKELGEAAGTTGESAAKLAGILSMVSPELGAMAMFANDAADALEVATKAGGGLVGPAGLGILAGVALAAGAAVASLQRDLEREATAARQAHEDHQRMIPVLRELRDVTLETALATGELTQAQYDERRARNQAQTSVEEFTEAQREERDAAREAMDTSQAWLEVLDPAWMPRAINGALALGDAVFGFSDSAADASARLAALDGQVQEFAGHAKQIRDEMIEGDAARRDDAGGGGGTSRIPSVAVRQVEDAALASLVRSIEALGGVSGDPIEALQDGLTAAALQGKLTADEVDRLVTILARAEVARDIEAASTEFDAMTQAVRAVNPEAQALRTRLDQLRDSFGPLLSPVEELSTLQADLVTQLARGGITATEYAEGLDTLRVATDRLAAAERDRAVMQAAGTVSTVAGGPAAVLGVIGSAGPVGALIASIADLVVNMGDTVQAFSDFHQEFWGNLANFPQMLADHLSDTLLTNSEMMLQAPAKLIEGLADALPQMLQTIAEAMPEIAAESVTQILFAMPQAAGTFIAALLDPDVWAQAARSFVEGLGESFGNLGGGEGGGGGARRVAAAILTGGASEVYRGATSGGSSERRYTSQSALAVMRSGRGPDGFGMAGSGIERGPINVTFQGDLVDRDLSERVVRDMERTFGAFGRSSSPLLGGR